MSDEYLNGAGNGTCQYRHPHGVPAGAPAVLAGRLALLRRYLGRITETLTTRMWLVVGALMLAPLSLFFTMIYFMPEEASIIYPSCIASIFSSFGCIYLTSYLCDSLKTTYLARQLEMQKNYYMDQLRRRKSRSGAFITT